MNWILIINMIFELFNSVNTSDVVITPNQDTSVSITISQNDNDIKQNTTQNITQNVIQNNNEAKGASYIDDFVTLNQNPQLPSGCEITTLTQTLNYYGYDVTKTYMADNYLTTAPLGTNDFNGAFMGNPYTNWSYGCYAPVIERDANRFFADNGNKHTAINITGSTAEQLYTYIDEGKPVIVWITICMLEPYESFVWNLGNKPVYFMSQEHCSTLIGYDKAKNTVSIADVYKGYTREYSMDLFELRYNQMGNMAIIIEDN